MLGPVLIAIDLALNGLDILSLGVPTYALGGAGNLIFMGSGIAVLHERQKRIDELEAEKSRGQGTPEGVITLVSEGGRFWLQVENQGNTAEFEAQAEVESGQEIWFKDGKMPPWIPSPFRLVWGSTSEPTMSLKRGFKDRLALGYLRSHKNKDTQEVETYSFAIDYFDPGSSGAHLGRFGTEAWSKDLTNEPALLIIRVTLSAEPPMKEPVICRFGLHRNLSFMELRGG